MEGRSVTVSISFGTVAKTVLFLVLLWVLWQLLDLFLVVLTAVVIASAIEPATRWLIKYRVPRVLAVIILYLSVAVFFAGIIYFFIPTLIQDLSGLSQQLPEYINSLDITNSPLGELAPAPFEERITETISARDTINNVVSGINRISENLFQVAAAIFGGALSFILIIVISFYLAVQERGIENFLVIVTPVKYEKYIIDLWHRAQNKIGLWLRGQLLLAVIVGIFVFLGLTIFGVPYAFLLAIVAGVFELIPIFGPILAAVPAVGLALLEGGLTSGLIVVVLYVVIQQFENQLLYPLVVRQVVGVPPIVAIVALIAGAKLAGLLGIILSIPMAAVMMELFNDLDKEKHLLREKGVRV